MDCGRDDCNREEENKGRLVSQYGISLFGSEHLVQDQRVGRKAIEERDCKNSAYDSEVGLLRSDCR